MLDRLVGAWRYSRYLRAQRRQSRAKRHKDASFRLVPFVQIVRQHCADLGPRSAVLSIGPRNRVELDILKSAGFANVTAIDVWSGAPGIIRCDMHAMTFPDSSFDLVFASHVFEHAYDFGRVASECVRVLKPGGYVFCAVPLGFEPNDHDPISFDSPKAILEYFARAEPQVVYEEVRESELRLLFRTSKRR